jgi:hypothetical protein
MSPKGAPRSIHSASVPPVAMLQLSKVSPILLPEKPKRHLK